MNMYITCDIHVQIEVCIKVGSKKYPMPYSILVLRVQLEIC